MKELLIATYNPGKFLEITEAMAGISVKPIFLRDLGVDNFGLAEDGVSFRENAEKKALFFAEKTGMLTMAEDSGIVVDALAGELGVTTRRWGAGENASDQEWIEFFMKRMRDESLRTAKFVCCACLKGDGVFEFFEGETWGKITERLEAPIIPGLPLSSCFLPEGCNEVYAAMSESEKNKISHRGKAMRAVAEFLSD
ncbi:MAG: non-canonical purine NTP pyrophosphatase [Candidatus Peregrinibacteria bacterium]